MFTGIVTDIGTIERLEDRGDLRVRIRCAAKPETIAIGASIACDGVCLTVVDRGPAASGDAWFEVDVSAESVSKTAIRRGRRAWAPGEGVNLERALKLGDEMGGHIVSGHVDGVGVVVETRAEGDSTRVLIEAPAALAPFIAPKGSIAMDGASLTVNEVAPGAGGGARFGVNLIPHTKAWTTFGDLVPGRRVNLEIDVLARYVARLDAQRRESMA